MEDWYAETRTWRKWSFPDFVVPNAFMLMGLLEAGDLDGALYVAGQLMTDTEAVADALTVGHCLSVLFDASAYSGDADHPFRSKAITCTGHRDHPRA